jgi:hypothetical protein
MNNEKPKPKKFTMEDLKTPQYKPLIYFGPDLGEEEDYFPDLTHEELIGRCPGDSDG